MPGQLPSNANALKRLFEPKRAVLENSVIELADDAGVCWPTAHAAFICVPRQRCKTVLR